VKYISYTSKTCKTLLFFGYIVYKLVEGVSDGTTGFEPATAKARFVCMNVNINNKERGQDYKRDVAKSKFCAP
jgi:hypothetical protein